MIHHGPDVALVLSRDTRARRLDDEWLIHFRADAPANAGFTLNDSGFALLVRFAGGALPSELLEGRQSDPLDIAAIERLVEAGFLLSTQYALGGATTNLLLEEIRDIRRTIPSDWLGLLELESLILYLLARENTFSEPVCELGSMFGGSTIALALGVRQNPRKNAVLAVDDHEWHRHLPKEQVSPTNLQRFPSTLAAFKGNLNAAGVSKEVQVVVDDTAAAGHGYDGNISLLFVDASHAYRALKADLSAWFPKLVSGGVVVVHDYGNSNWPDVRRAVDEWAGSFSRFAQIQTLAVATKASA